MKTLYITRHAKSSWDDLSLDDFTRPLSKRGKEDIKLIAKQLKKRKINLDKIYSSSAIRAIETCKILSKEIGYDFEKIIFDKQLYDNHKSSIDFYISYILELNNKLKNVAIVGHNNVFSELASYFIGSKVLIPTSGVIKLDFNIKNWSELSYSKVKLDYFIYPKMFKN